ncbi:hypothetical protein [Pedobacter sp. GR22-6]|uniref:hypothetical protein n=1 Tax=Pedobacter sp. GR22-6 TaxID=3127957 RepID=UPI00307D50EB
MTERELISRWDGFLDKLELRFEEALQLGEQAVLESLEDNDYNYYASARTLQAIKAQLYEDLVQKISTTWQRQVEPLMRAQGHFWAEESYKGHRQAESMNERIGLWQIVTEGRLSQKYYDHIIPMINRDFFCTQCNALLNVKKNFFMAQYVNCSYCGAINTFEPESKYVAIGWNVVNNIAALNALDEYTIMQRTERGAEYNAAARKYYERYFDERIKLLPHTAATRDQDIELELKKQSQ